MKISMIIDTRPEIIKMAPLLEKIKNMGLNKILIHMGQHYINKYKFQLKYSRILPNKSYRRVKDINK